MKPYYSKKVIEHFLHPKNMGKIKDASGIGDTQNMRCGDVMKMYIKVKKVGGKEIIEDVKFETFGCLPPKGEVLFNEGDWGAISTIKKGKTVLNSNGRATTVLKTFKRKYSGPMLTLLPFVSPFNKFSVTSEHPVFCIKRNKLKSARRYNKKCDWLKIKKDELLSKKPDPVFAGELVRGDYLVYVSNRKIKDNPQFTSKIMKLIGYYLAEGYVTANSGALNFSLNKNEKDNIAELQKLLIDVTKKVPKERIRGNVIEIYICSRQWCKFFKKICGSYATQKKLADEILVLPSKKQWEMIKTYIKGDGSSSVRRVGDYPRYEITTASKDLAIQMQEILARCKIFSSIRKRKFDPSRNYIEGRKVSSGPIYDVFFRLKRKGHNFVYFTKNYFLVPIKKIIRSKYAGYVYNMLVDGTPNSYLVKGFAVHNCGHAISISDIMCEVVKGKTIEEALKIDYKDIVKELGEVPPAKVHCSYLAKSALKAAVDDYNQKFKK
ncbi:MAG: iron-sulfur cluster assembly scaffold protein [Candidatus Nealsonbacteria bacterium]|nr:iron-sulfur cluster assembly scaffold protein [Candidatus Nealsonbacteria bacterium]